MSKQKKLSDNEKRVRSAGILMPVFSLPSPYGIGTLGKAAKEFVDFLAKMKHRYWQVLPVGPTGYGDSPYQSYSAFAGNPYFIDLDLLVAQGLLTPEEIREGYFGTEPRYVDYGAQFGSRFAVLRKAFARSKFKETPEYAAFVKKTSYWLRDYCLFMAIKEDEGFKPWQEWSDHDLKLHKKAALERAEERLAAEVAFQEFMQFMFFTQWHAVRAYAAEKGVEIIGDIPLYVAMDSADTWAHSELFELDIDRNATNIAGVPPDAFSDEGQRWGNPLYRWDVMEQKDFKWWRERMKANAELFDVIRIDHFIGIVNYWSIPAKCKTAKGGKWLKGPGKKLTDVIDEAAKGAKIIAEDLGVLTKPVKDLIAACGYPGMKVLEFGVGGDPTNPYLPHNYTTPNCVAYIGTHDNETLAGFLAGCPDWQINWMMGYFGILKREELHDQMIRRLYESVADTVIIQIQDLLHLDNSARINHPSTLGSNWQWRLLPGELSKIDTGYRAWLCDMFGRAPEKIEEKN